MRHLCQDNVRRSYYKPPIVKTLAKASGTRHSQQVQEPRANARRLISNSVAGIIHQPERVSVDCRRLIMCTRLAG